MWQLLNRLVAGLYRCLGWRGKAPKQQLTPAGASQALIWLCAASLATCHTSHQPF
jgi:hypothetical protein